MGLGDDMSNSTAITTDDAPSTDEVFDRRLVGVGVSLEALRANVALAEHSLDGGSIRPVPISSCPIPPAVLLPRVSGEPLRIDLATPPHPRGTGDAWPPESVLSAKDGGGRLPLAFVWPAFMQEARREWLWMTPEGVTQQVSPAEAIAGAFAALIDLSVKQSEEPLVLVVPNRLRMDRQQELIDACWAHDCRVKLLWQPIAAALAWCEQQAADLLRQTKLKDGSIGKLLCLHLGLDEFEATPLELVVRSQSGERSLLPARSRPSVTLPTFPSFGLELLVRQAASKIGYRSGDDTNPLWRELWTTSRTFEVISELNPHENDRDAISPQLIGSDDWRTIARAGDWFPPPRSFRDFENWLDALKKELHQEQWLGVMVTGELAATQFIGQKRLWAYCLDAIANESARGRSLVDGSPMESRSMLARGAAIYAARLSEGRLAYLDSLPRIQTATYQSGKLSWFDLLNPDDTFVEGGKLWRRPNPVQGLKVQAGRHQLDVTIQHDEFRTVRQVIADFPEAVSRDVQVTLDVSVEPAAGNASVEVIPSETGVLGTRRLFLEWRRMKDLNKTPEDWLNSLETICPPLMRRAASQMLWPSAHRALVNYLSNPNDRLLRTVISRVQQPDGTFFATDPDEEKTANAVSSDGNPPSGESQELDRFVDHVLHRLAVSSGLALKEHVRALAYAWTSRTEFQNYLDKRIQQPFITLEPHELEACGRCLHTPERIAHFANAVATFLSRADSGPNNWLKAFARMLRYRKCATRDIESSLCETLTRQILDVFEQQRTTGSAQYIFTNSSLCIVYLLRRREYDDEYLHPTTALAIQVRESFERAIADLRAHRLRVIGGSIRLDQVLHTMIKYINRQGPPLLSADGLRDLAD